MMLQALGRFIEFPEDPAKEASDETAAATSSSGGRRGGQTPVDQS
jgi:hypothetical protein